MGMDEKFEINLMNKKCPKHFEHNLINIFVV